MDSISDERDLTLEEQQRILERAAERDLTEEEQQRILELILEREDTSEPPKRPHAGRGRLCQTCPSCQKNDGPPCDALITDTLAVLRDESRWPRHICSGVGMAANDDWLLRETRCAVEKVFLPRLTQGPVIPLGLRSLERTLIRATIPWGAATDTALHAAMPFEGDEYAALILTARLPQATVTMFVLAEEREHNFEVCGPSFTVAGPRPNHRDVISLTLSARRFWNRFAGSKAYEIHPGGRRTKLPDDPSWVYDKYSAYEEIADDSGWTNIPKKHFVQFVAPRFGGLSERAFRDYCRKHRVPWPPISDA